MADDPLANEERGERQLVLAGRTYRLRPSFAACQTIEKRCDRSIISLSLLAAAGVMPLEPAGIIAAELIRAGAYDDLTRRVSTDRIEELIFETGLLVVQLPLAEALKAAASGGVTVSGEARAAAIDTNTAA